MALDGAGNLGAGESGEFDENTVRKDFTPSEQVAIADALEKYEKDEARKRQGTRTDKHPENFSGSSGGLALDKTAKAAGTNRISLTRARAVVAAAKADPQYQPLLDEMDRTGRVNGVYRKLVSQQQMVGINYCGNCSDGLC